ncbi:trypsin-like peptidase domain-containing protein [Streptomyces sp. DH24]|uniref:VMAP-C domain-containing protein n=1 Tax=Streptomyces sp. DH24 TaxID=3040123 RepID=UPI002441D508|nr:trypsin-like peptidase domain-containing protein [Streptomyces sp. DH24]MDG9716563.1 trypsin-like peptidase domain-containing protein [Streptomyces sp. DH24]
MTDGHAPGASSALDAARRALRGLVMAATVRIHRAGVGYAHDEPETFLGSGFFVAPSWVLTCAHVACGGEGGEVAVVYESAPGRGTSAVPGRVVSTLPDGAVPVPGNWPAPDLALVQLREPVDHECVYLSERPAAYYGEGKVLYAGWTVMAGRLQVLDGTLAVQGTIGGWSADVQMRLGENDLPYGVSGGPVIDPVRGEVVGVLKSRSDHARGGTSTGLEQLRTLPVPTEAVDAEHTDPYQAVFHAHDRYHRNRQRQPDTRRHTWVDVQSRLGARPGRTLSPDERVQLLGRLADLPPPVSTRALLDILDDLPDFQAPVPLPAPRGWRDGLGALYESVRDDGALRLVVDYAMGALSAERPFVAPSTPEAEKALWDWVWRAAQRLDARYRHKLAEQWDGIQRERRRPRPGGTGPRQDGAATPGEEPREPVPGGAQPSVLVELVQRGWERDRCDWSVSVAAADGEVIRLHEAERAPLDGLPALMAAPLAEAFRRCDEPGRPAVLQVALPHPLLGIEADTWQLRPDEGPLGTLRPVVLRCSDRDQLPEDDEFGGLDSDPYDIDAERRARWRWLHTHRAKAEVLDCDDGLRKPVPTVEQLRSLSHGTVPVLCRYGDHRYEDDAAALARIVRGGYGVALWRRRRAQSHALCGEFHRGTLDEIASPASVHGLPVAVHHLRMRLRSGRPETYWADGIALLYDDPHQPLPGGDLLEAP